MGLIAAFWRSFLNLSAGKLGGGGGFSSSFLLCVLLRRERKGYQKKRKEKGEGEKERDSCWRIPQNRKERKEGGIRG